MWPYLLLLALILTGSLILAIRAGKKEAASVTFDNVVLGIRVPKENEKGALAAEQMFSALHGLLKLTPEVQEHVSFEIESSVDGIHFFAVCPRPLRSFVESQIYAQYPKAEIKEAEDYTRALDPQKTSVDGACLLLEKDFIFPIRTFPDFEVDPLASITSAISDLSVGEHVWLQLLLRPTPDTWQQSGYDYIERVREGKKPTALGVGEILGGIQKEMGEVFLALVKGVFAPSPGSSVPPKSPIGQMVRMTAAQELEVKSVELKLTKMGFDAAIRVVAIGQSTEAAQTRLRGCLASFRQFSTAHLNSFLKGPEITDKAAFFRDFAARAFPVESTFVLNTEELASIFHLPSVSVETPAIAWSLSKKGEPPLNLPVKDCVYFAKTNFHNRLVNFGIKTTDRRTHVYLVGKTGTGKSTVFKNMIVQDMEEGRGVGVLDPHGDAIEQLLDFVPDSRVDDVVILDPSDAEMPVSINLLECPDPRQKNLMASGLVTAIRKHFENSWGPRLEYLLNNSILTLTEVPNTTMLGITRLLLDKNYQKYIVYQIKDPVLKDFWENEFKQLMGNTAFHTEAIQPIQNKIGRFLATSTIRNILGQAKSTIMLDKVMDEGKILFVNLSKGKIGEDNANLLGSLIISRLNFMAMRRVNIPENERRDFFLYADEFQNFASGSFANILSEARKYRLCLNLTHQYTAQLPEEVQDAIFGNVGTIITFALGAPDAKVLMPELAPFFTETDIITLDRYHIYLKLMIDGMTSLPFSALTLPPPGDEERTGNREKVLRLSRQKYGRPVAEVEERVKKWTETQFDLGTAKAQEARSAPQPAVQPHPTPPVQTQVKPVVEQSSSNVVEGEIKIS